MVEIREVKEKVEIAMIFKQQGIALLVVMGSITILTYLIVDFTFETHVNKLRVHNVSDRLQARLTAEAGLNVALARIRLYQEARNLYEKNQALQEMVDLSILEESIRNPDFIMPIPLIEQHMTQTAISAINEFNNDSLLPGELHVSITAVGGFLNPNNLRYPQREEGSRERDFINDQDEQRASPQELIEQRLVDALTQAMERKREEDDFFDARYGNLDPRLLVKELKFYVNHPNDFNEPERAEIEALYLRENIRPKHAPMTSLEELYRLQGWDDEIVNLIKNRLTVHEVSVIQVNELTEEQLKIIFPEITDFQIEEFFKYRDGDPERDEPPRPFRSASDFRSVVINHLAIVSEEVYDDIISSFESAGLSISVAGKLFRVRSRAHFNRAEYTLKAYIDLPVKPTPEPDDQENEEENNNQVDEFGNPIETEQEGENEEQEEHPIEFLPPRAVEIRRL